MEGWIKTHRKLLENPIVCKDSDHIAIWMYLLLHATHKEYPTVFLGNKIILMPGQLITGRKVIAEKFNISESKVQRVLKTFENEQQIEQQNGNKNRLVSILSWSDYQNGEQQNEQQLNNNRTTTEQQLNTYKNVKNDNKKNNLKEYIHLEDMDHVKITKSEFDKLTVLIGDEEKVMDKLYYFASWILGQSDKKQKTASPYLSITAWHKKSLEKIVSSNVVNFEKKSTHQIEDEIKQRRVKAQMEATQMVFEPRELL